MRRTDSLNRVCYACDSTETYTSKTGNVQWFSNQPIGWLCKRCNTKYIVNPKWHPITHAKRICWNGKAIQISKAPRVGVCNWCRAVSKIDCYNTHMHHESYDEIDALRYSIEICDYCHGKHHRKLQLEALARM